MARSNGMSRPAPRSAKPSSEPANASLLALSTRMTCANKLSVVCVPADQIECVLDGHERELTRR